MRKFIMRLKIKGCEIVFDEKMGAGIISWQEIEFPTAKKEDDENIYFWQRRQEEEEKFMRYAVEVEWEEVEDDL